MTWLAPPLHLQLRPNSVIKIPPYFSPSKQSLSHKPKSPTMSSSSSSPPPPSSDHHPKIHINPVQVNTSSPRFPPPPATPNSLYAASSPSLRRIAIAVDLSAESAFAVRWAADNYIRPGDTVILLHVRSTSVLYGADWGSSTPTSAGAGAGNPFTKDAAAAAAASQRTEEELDGLAARKAGSLAQPLVEAHVPVRIHIVKDHDMKERLCLEVERLGLSAVIMGSRGIGATARGRREGRLGSVSDYCVQHCACPVVVVRYKHDGEEDEDEDEEKEREEENEFHDANDQLTK
ncbi:universal stress protein PHOS32-like [Salvia hispanica]|uniref:universal stress protein PHOS32-like n=1 Tax=Salvia hispanica TaxID=49212 RepID=UPI0020094E47|nr:universal stress protein PHOS32-like [Salvia hispanica]